MVLCACLAPAAWAGDAERFDNDVYPVAFRVKVNDAIRAGVQHLRRLQQPDGSWHIYKSNGTGRTALAVLTLLKCGVKPEDASVLKAFEYIKAHPPTSTYDVATTLMAIDAKYAPGRDPFSENDYDKAGALRNRDACARSISKEDKAWMKGLAAILVHNQNQHGAWRYGAPSDFDLSNIQFALLGLHAATRCGVSIKPVVWVDALKFLLDNQDRTGEPVEYRANEVRGKYRFEWIEPAMARPFRYVPSYGPTGSMTSAGLCSMIICQNRLWRHRSFGGKLRARTRDAIRDAMAWLQHNFHVDHNPGWGGNWHGYYLYGLERAGILGRFRFLGQHDWYQRGGEHILKSKMHLTVGVDSCFTLLFLKRATSRMDAPVITPSGGPITDPIAMPPATTSKWLQVDPQAPKEPAAAGPYWAAKLKHRDANEVFRATIQLARLKDVKTAPPLTIALRTHQDPYVRAGAAVALGKMRACHAVRPLIENLMDAKDLVRHAASQALARVTGHKKLSYRTNMTANERMRLLKAWRAWWGAHEMRVREALRQPK